MTYLHRSILIKRMQNSKYRRHCLVSLLDLLQLFSKLCFTLILGIQKYMKVPIIFLTSYVQDIIFAGGKVFFFFFLNLNKR